MSDLDLIPPHYRRTREALRFLKWAAAALCLIAVTVGATRFSLEFLIEQQGEEIAELERQRARIEALNARRAVVESERTLLTQRLRALEGLRGGIAAKDMFRVVDAALDEDIWFRQWRFLRAGETVEAPEQATETGYFIILPQKQGEEKRRAWRMRTQMEIVAEAANHGALARFVRRLSQAPEVESARILNTHGQPEGRGETVNFELAILVRSAP